MAISWYLCKFCATLIRTDNTPSNLNCSKSNVHVWTRLSDVGPNNYFCKKCGTLIQGTMSPKPSNIGCPNTDNGTSHIWYSLGVIGVTNYRCINCGTILRSEKYPNSNGCITGSNHYWKKM